MIIYVIDLLITRNLVRSKVYENLFEQSQRYLYIIIILVIDHIHCCGSNNDCHCHYML